MCFFLTQESRVGMYIISTKFLSTGTFTSFLATWKKKQLVELREMGDWKDCNWDCVKRELVRLGERERDGGLERLQLRLCEERVGETWRERERWGTGKTATETVWRESWWDLEREREMGDWKDCNWDCVKRELVRLGERERDGGLERLQLRLCEERVGETWRERWGTGKTATETVWIESWWDWERDREMGDWKDCDGDCVKKELMGLGERETWGNGNNCQILQRSGVMTSSAICVVLTAATGRRISTKRPARACLVSLSFTSRK